MKIRLMRIWMEYELDESFLCVTGDLMLVKSSLKICIKAKLSVSNDSIENFNKKSFIRIRGVTRGMLLGSNPPIVGLIRGWSSKSPFVLPDCIPNSWYHKELFFMLTIGCSQTYLIRFVFLFKITGLSALIGIHTTLWK